MLQVIKAEDVRDGEPRWYCADQRHADEQIRDGLDGPLHLTDRGKEWFASWPLAIVDRPAPHSPPMPGTGAPRDPARIDPILARLRAAWHRSPDLRLGQLIVGSIPIGHLDRADAIRRLFNAECHEFGAAGAPVEWPAPPTAIPTNRFDCAKCGQAVKADEDGCCATCGRDCTIVVDGAQPPPVLDLDAAEKRAAGFRGVFRVMSYDSGDEFLEYIADGSDDDDPTEIAQFSVDDQAQRAIADTLNAAPHLIAEARAAVALRQELAALRAHFDAAAPEHNLPALLDLYNDRTTEAREKLAEAKRLGLEAVKLSRDAIEAARMAPVDEPAATVVAIGCLNAADRIAAALEAL